MSAERGPRRARQLVYLENGILLQKAKARGAESPDLAGRA
jgi:hypothetical protein